MIKPESELENEIAVLIRAKHLSEARKVELVIMRLRLHSRVIGHAARLGLRVERENIGWGNDRK